MRPYFMEQQVAIQLIYKMCEISKIQISCLWFKVI